MQALAQELGVELNEQGFARSDGYRPGRTTQPGVFVAGAFREPKDIPETVAEAAGAAAEVAGFLHEAVAEAGSESPGDKPGSTEAALRDVTDEEPQVGVFVCECDGELAAAGVPEVVAWARELPGVAVAQAVAAGCTAEGRATIGAVIEAEGLNRVVVAGCTQRLYTQEFEALMQGAGLDARLLARVNLREQVVYPHRGNGGDLTGKAQSLVGMAVAGLRSMAGLEAMGQKSSPALTRRALVVGGGAAGMRAALALARQGIAVDLVEREGELGGQWRQIRYQADGSNPQAALQELIAEVEAEERIRLHTGARLAATRGGPGQYRSVIEAEGEERAVEHGVVVVATGGKEAATEEYHYGQDPRVLTQRELEQQMAEGTLATAQRVVMIQCVGSREPERPYCSRVCCTQAVKNALRL
jgi:heterodisulfide reductase subunit A